MSHSAERAENLFCEAAAIADPAARAAFLDVGCKGDPGLRAELEALLAHDVSGERIFTPSGAESDRTAAFAAESIGAVIGPYKLL
ncbi:MAG TPA: hypothetical protein VNC50_05475, partial [Planctomycetia bacterium]|nr:hypothetical protein [Planctomycetia bacterium]